MQPAVQQREDASPGANGMAPTLCCTEPIPIGAASDDKAEKLAKGNGLEGVVKEMDKDKKGARTADVAAENEGKDETVAP